YRTAPSRQSMRRRLGPISGSVPPNEASHSIGFDSSEADSDRVIKKEVRSQEGGRRDYEIASDELLFLPRQGYEAARNRQVACRRDQKRYMSVRQ
ncbi:unnamed protein product, partial [Mesorhabditis spiculigera]